ncbi:hypothetical protein [Flavobacterium sp.]|uniref:hypothetical protein n=1 Tax=Flavobacterium sp. TaxID=239 RepID=UPI002FD9A28B
MTTTNNTTTQKNVTNVRLFVLFVLLVLSSTGVFGQNTTTTALSTTTSSTQVSVAKETTAVITTANGIATMDVASWLMGENNTNGVKTNATNFGKKQLINAGVSTNSVLVRSFLKKVVSQESSVA